MSPERNTPQRQVILDVISAAKGPLTVNEILDKSQIGIPGLGIATVYRNIKRLHENQQIHAHVFPDGSTRYEPAGDHHHHHFLCGNCNRSYCFDTCPVHIGDVALPIGFNVARHELILHGTCPDCQSS